MIMYQSMVTNISIPFIACNLPYSAREIQAVPVCSKRCRSSSSTRQVKTPVW